MLKLTENSKKEFNKMMNNGGFKYAYELFQRSLENKEYDVSKMFYQLLNGMMVYQMWEDRISPASYKEICDELSYLIYGV